MAPYWDGKFEQAIWPSGKGELTPLLMMAISLVCTGAGAVEVAIFGAELEVNAWTLEDIGDGFAIRFWTTGADETGAAMERPLLVELLMMLLLVEDGSTDEDAATSSPPSEVMKVPLLIPC
jgi:hypothetical protein